MTRTAAFALGTLALATTVAADAQRAALRADPAVVRAIADPARAGDRARDRYRHPAETLAFFGVTPAKKVVEFSPGGGWYTAILARLPAGGGSYTALVTPRGLEGTRKLLADKGLNGTVATLDAGAGTSTVPAGSQDVVLTFRNVHNLTMSNVAPGAFKAWFAMLKPGGTLGIEDHRLPEAANVGKERDSGYLKTSTVRRLAEQAGFRFAGASEVNANPRDTHDHPGGVWSLPPTLRGGATDRDKYVAVGESDRMTLRFVKPR